MVGSIEGLDGPRSMIRGQVGILHGHGKAGVAQQFLDSFDVHAIHDQVGRKRVTQVVKTKIFDFCLR